MSTVTASFLAQPFHFFFFTVPKGVCVSEGVEFKVGLLPDTSSYELMLPESEFSEVLVVNTHTKSRIRMACNSSLPVVLCTTGNGHWTR